MPSRRRWSPTASTTSFVAGGAAARCAGGAARVAVHRSRRHRTPTAQWNAAEVLRQDRLLKDRDAALDRQAAHVAHLEALVAERERLVESARHAARRDERRPRVARARARRRPRGIRGVRGRRQDESGRMLARREGELAKARAAAASLQAEQKRLEAALLAQERIIAYQQSLRGWLHAPWLQLKRAVAAKAGQVSGDRGRDA